MGMLAASPFANPSFKRLLYTKHTPSRPFCTPEEFAALVVVAPQVSSKAGDAASVPVT